MRTLGPLRSGSHRQTHTTRQHSSEREPTMSLFLLLRLSPLAPAHRAIIGTSVRIYKEKKGNSYSASRDRQQDSMFSPYSFLFRVSTSARKSSVYSWATEIKAGRLLMESSNLQKLLAGSFPLRKLFARGRILEEALEPTILRRIVGRRSLLLFPPTNQWFRRFTNLGSDVCIYARRGNEDGESRILGDGSQMETHCE